MLDANSYNRNTLIFEDHIQAQNIRRRTNSNFNFPENYNQQEVSQKIRNMRTMNIDLRVKSLFSELDELGNYTNQNWFTSLNFGEYIRLFRIMKDIWNYRSRTPFLVKLRICPLWDPFANINDLPLYQRTTYSHVKCLCVTVMEDLIYMGIDRDHKMLGAFQILTALTIISTGARQAMPYLYESLF